MRNAFSFSMKGKSLPTPPSGTEWAALQTVNAGEARMNPGIRILPQSSVNGLLGGWTRGQSIFLSLGWEAILEGE